MEMCWKYEWAMAINNLEHAKDHVEKARDKLRKRFWRNEKNLQRLRRSKKYNYPSQTEPVEQLMAKNQIGIDQCTTIIADIKEKQNQLFRMIHQHGIKHLETPQRVYQLMGGYAKSLEKQ